MATISSNPVPIPFSLSSMPGAHPQESAGRLINCFSEPLGQTAIADRVYRRVAGIKSWGTTARTGYRGSMEVNGTLYSAFSGHMEKHTAAGASTTVGSLNGTKRGFFARNNAATPDMVFVDPDTNVAVFTSSTVTNSFPDADLPAPNSVTSIDGYMVFSIGDGRCFSTGLNTTSVDALSFGKAEFKPDGLVRVITSADLLLMMGNYTTEIWTDQGLTPFPFQRATVIPRGLAGPYAVAGFDNYFSKALLWVADDNSVYQLQGYTPNKVSPPDLDRLIEAVSDKTTLDACSYMVGGHPLWELSCPAWTWTFDLSTGNWHERYAYQATRSRIIGSVYAFGKWLAGDTASGNINEITSLSYYDIANPLRFRIESGPVNAFPNRTRVSRVDFDFAVGVGQASGVDPIQTDPTVEISWSDDGGHTWANPLLRKLGRQSIGKQRITLLNTGVSGVYGRRWRLDVSDPVYVGFMGGIQSTEVRSF